MRYQLAALILLVAACGSPVSKTGTPNSSANNTTNNVVLNNQTSNNVVLNNVVLNNEFDVCGPDPSSAEPERLLGLTGLEFAAGQVEGWLVNVESDVLTISFPMGDAQPGEARFFFDGGDLSELFEPETAVFVLVTESVNGRTESVAGPAGIGAEIGWGSKVSLDGPPSATLELPLAAASVTLGAATDSMTCLVDADCRLQPRTRRVHDIVVDYRAEETTLSRGDELLEEEYSFRNLGSASVSHGAVMTDSCVAEGGTLSAFRVSSWGRVFL